MNSWRPHQNVLTEVCSPKQLSRADFTAMLNLMHRYYRRLNPKVFFRDLREKDYVLCLRASDEAPSPRVGDELPSPHPLVGFSTQKLFTLETESGSVRVLFSGDTIVDREHWNSPHLARIWGRFVMQQIESSAEPLYWFLLSKGFRTYRFLPLFFRSYVPSLAECSDLRLEALRNVIGQHVYGNAYNPKTKIVKAEAIDNYSLRPGVADVDEKRLRDPYVRLFLQLNPNHQRGDELCCLAPLTIENFTTAARRVIGASYF